MTTTKTTSSAARPQSTPVRYYMRRPASYAGKPYDREQVLVLSGQPNDERLERLGYVAKLDTKPVACSECGALFRSAGGRDAHAAKRHRPAVDRRPTMAPRQPGESEYDYDRRADAFRRSAMQHEQDEESREERRLDREAPLNWENTRASREAEL